MKRLMRKTMCVLASMVLVMLAVAPSAPAEGSLPVVGTVLGVEGIPIVDALVTVTNIDTDEYLTDYTDQDGDWAVDLEDLVSGWSEGNVVEIKVTHQGDMIYAARAELSLDMEMLDFTRNEIAGNPRLPLDYMNKDDQIYTTDDWFPNAVIVKTSSPCQFQTEMRYKDEYGGIYQGWLAEVHQKFWAGKANTGFWIPKDVESPTKDWEYNGLGFDTNEYVHTITVTPPQGTQRWYCQFSIWGDGPPPGAGPSWAFTQWVNSGTAVWQTALIPL